jgi:hypothetical protein
MSSFALEFRKKHFLAEAETKAGGRIGGKQGSGRVMGTAARADTRASRAIALRALIIATAILAIFNSEGLRLAAFDLAETGFGRSLVDASEAWDGAMERAGAKTLVANVRAFVGEAREASWSDIAGMAQSPVFAFRDRKGGGAPPESYTGALPTPASLDDRAPRFKRSEAGGR